MVTYSSSLRNATLTGLKPFRQYTCNVTAATAAGVGLVLLAKQVCSHYYIIDYIVCLSAPSGPPLSITVTSSQRYELILSWTPHDMSL